MIERRRLSDSQEVSLSLLGPPTLLENEDAAICEELAARIRKDLKPNDAIEEILIGDVIDATFAALRWRRLKALLLNTAKLETPDQTVNSAGSISVRSMTLDPEFFSIQQKFLGALGLIEAP